MFCGVCERMLANLADSYTESKYQKGHHHLETRDLLISAGSGCGICVRLENRLRQIGIHFRFSSNRSNDPWLRYTISLSESGFFHLSIIGYDKGAVLGSFHGHPLESALKPSSYCEQQHPSCREHEDHKYQPPRLLQLHQSSIRLVETQKSATSHRYVALSYCWGRRAQHLTLIAGNIETLRKGLSIDELAKTFRHAIEVARSLGSLYLWIDVLYIIQDGDNYIEDWERHLAEMADIYVNCKANIAADHGEDADAGLFRRRLPDEIMPCIFGGAAFPKNNGEESAQQDEPQLRTVYDIVDPYSDDNLVRRSPLMRRAWVHQERLLSRRVLHFGDQQLTWECTKFVACETYPAGLPSYLDIGVPFSWYNGKSEQWYHIIGRYSAAFLSRQKDRLPAITGISKRICDGGSARYAAGMIIVDLPESLLWQYDGGLYGGVVRPYRAPSWSWASREGAVLFCHAKMTGARQDFAQVDSVHLVYADPYNQFGELKEGILRLTGPLISISETGSQQRAFTIDLQLYPSHSVDNLSLPSYSGLFFAESPLL